MDLLQKKWGSIDPPDPPLCHLRHPWPALRRPLEIILSSSTGDLTCDAAAAACKQAGVRRIEALSVPGRRLPRAARGAVFSGLLGMHVTYFQHYWACADSFAYAS